VPDEPPPVRFDAALAERYEQLRAAAIGGRADGWRLGLGVLSGKGVAAWLRAWTTCPSPARVGEPSAPTPGSGPAPSGPEGAELVRVLAAMALAYA
jgi:hypothetical protein